MNLNRNRTKIETGFELKLNRIRILNHVLAKNRTILELFGTGLIFKLI